MSIILTTHEYSRILMYSQLIIFGESFLLKITCKTTLEYMGNQCSCFPLEKDGFAFIPWIGSIMGDCIYNPQEQASVLLRFVDKENTIMLPRLKRRPKRQKLGKKQKKIVEQVPEQVPFAP
jgi:hypothetical protein